MSRRTASAVRDRSRRTARGGELHRPEFPRCDGKVVARPSARGTELEKIRWRFLEAYDRINRVYARLRALRERGGARGDRVVGRERRLLRQVEVALRAKETLEDRYAPRGIAATPVYEKGLTVDVQFGYPGRMGAVQKVVSSAAMLISFAVPSRGRA